MGLRHRLGRLLSDRLDKLRRSGIGRRENRGSEKRPDRRYRPIFESLEQRVVMTGFWQALNPQNPTAGPAAGSKALMLLSNGDILVQGTPTLTQANLGPTDVWYRLTPDSTGNYVLGSWGSQSHMNVPRLYSPT